MTDRRRQQVSIERAAASSSGTSAEPSVNECHDELCITCSDSAVPVRITELLPDGMASVDTGFGIEQVSVALVEARPGDVVLVHAREAIAVLGSDQPLRPGTPPQP